MALKLVIMQLAFYHTLVSDIHCYAFINVNFRFYPNLCYILSFVYFLTASDGLVFWNRYLPDVDRDSVMVRMREAIKKWKINSKRNINYR